MSTAVANWIQKPNRILVASSDPRVRARVLADPGYSLAERSEACGGAHALAKLKDLACDEVLLDRNLADLDASEVAELIRREYPQIEVSWIEGEAGGESPNRRTSVVEDIEREKELGWSGLAPVEEPELPGMIGSSEVMREVYRLVRMVAKRDTSVLVMGETGTGKELVAEAIHRLSLRAKQPFVVVNCAAIPESLLEAELFGHVRGAYTGAVQSKLGRIHVAQGGTLFLDEIGELPLGMQAKLLRFLQSGEVQRLGSTDIHRVDVRVICATNVKLDELVEAKQFRMDLYYRLAVFPIILPALRERAGDIVRLAGHFLQQLQKENRTEPKVLTERTLDVLGRKKWPGNVRELQHAIERAFILSGDELFLRPEYFPGSGLDREH